MKMLNNYKNIYGKADDTIFVKNFEEYLKIEDIKHY
jgi:hypothetical protein